MDYEQWTLAEISRLRAVAKTVTAEADTLELNLNKWLESRGRRDVAVPTEGEPTASAGTGLNGHSPKRKRAAIYGNKNALALERIKAASPHGLTIDELYKNFVETYGPKYKRSSMRALLWHQSNKAKNIELRDGRYVALQNETAG